MQAIEQNFKKLCQLFNISSQTYPEPRARLQAKIILGFVLFYTVAWITYIPFYLWLQNRLAAGLVAVFGLPTSLTGLALLRIKVHCSKAAVVANFGGFAVLAGIAVATGGAYSPIYAWFFFVTITTFLLNGRRIGRFMALSCMLMTAAIILAEVSGYRVKRPFEFSMGSDNFKYFQLYVYVSSLFFLALVTNIYDNLQKQAFSDANEARLRAREQFQTVNNLLNNMQQAVFVVNEQATIVAPVSRHTQVIFGENLENKQVFETVFKDVDRHSEVYSKLTTIFNLVFGENLLQWEALADQLPQTYDYQIGDHLTHHLRITFHPICDRNEIIYGIMLVIEDVTAVVEAERKLKRERETNMQLFQGIEELLQVSIPRSLEYIENTLVLFDKIDSALSESSVDAGERTRIMLRTLHTIKGNARQLGFARISRFIHAREQDILDHSQFSEDNANESVYLRQELANVYRIIAEYNDILFRYFNCPHIFNYYLSGKLVQRLYQVRDAVLEDARRFWAEGLLDFSILSESTEIEQRVRRLDALYAQSIADESRQETIRSEIDALLGDLTVFRQQQEDGQLQQKSTGQHLEVYEGNIARIQSFIERLPDRISNQENYRSLVANLKFLVQRIDEQQVKSKMLEYQAMVDELADRLDKKVRFDVYGDEATLSREKISTLSDAMVHLIRNAIDHAIEKVETRIAHGKNPVGVLEVDCHEDKGFLTVHVRDDGAGIDTEKLYQKAVAAGVIEATKELTEQERLQLMFLPRLSTKDEQSEISGRGFGMEAVQASIYELGGTLTVTTESGQGTTIALRIPIRDSQPMQRAG